MQLSLPPLQEGGRSVVYVAICADSTGVRIDVALIREIIPYGVVWAASIVRLHHSPVASRVAVNILSGESRWTKNYHKD